MRHWGTQQRLVHVGAGPSTYLALTENFNRGWTATLHGKTLRPVRLDSWRQAWVVPAGATGDVALSFGPARQYQWFLISGFALLFLVVYVAIRRPRRVQRFEAPGVSSGARAFPMATAYAAVCLLGLMLAGVTGGLVAVVFIAAWATAPKSPALGGLAALSFASAGVIAAIRHTTIAGDGVGAFGAPAQALAVVALVALAVTLLGDRETST